MSSLKQSFMGLLTALLSGAIVLGSLALSLVESTPVVAGLPEQGMNLGQPVLPTLGPFLVDQIPTVSLNLAPETAAISAAIGDFSSAGPSCTTSPSGWALYIVMPDDTPASVAQRFGVSLAEFFQNNCLEVEVKSLPAGSTVFVPMPAPLVSMVALQPADASLPIALPSELTAKEKTHCGPPSYWSVYTVRWGDTLSYLAAATGVTVADLRKANCMRADSSLRAGQTLYVPFIAANPVVASPQARRPIATPVPPTPVPTHYPTLPSIPPQPTAPTVTEIPTEPPLPTVEPTDPPLPTVEPTEPPLPTVEPTEPPLPTVEPTEPPLPTVEPTEPPLPTVEPTEPPLPTVEPTEPPLPTVEPTEPPLPTVEPAEERIPQMEPPQEPIRSIAPLEKQSLPNESMGALLEWWDPIDTLGVVWPGRWLNTLPYIVLYSHYRHWIG